MADNVYCGTCLNQRETFAWSTVEKANLLGPCPDCRIGDFLEVELNRKHRKLQPWLDRLERDLGIYKSVTFADFDLDREFTPIELGSRRIVQDFQRDSIRNAYRNVKRYAESPQGWLYIWGPTGSGKSMLAAAAANVNRAMGRTVAYVSVPQLLNALRSGIRDNSINDQIERLQQADMVVMDDMLAEQPTEWALEQLFLIINARYQTEADTIVTSNSHLDRYPEPYKRITDRLRQAREVALIASSYRPIAGKK